MTHRDQPATRREVHALRERLARVEKAIEGRAPADATEIEQLIDTLVDKTWWCAQAGKSEVDVATADCKAARSALLAAIRAQVPAELAGLLREQADAWIEARACLDSDDPGRSTAPFVRWENATHRVEEWTRANLKETP